MAVDCSGLSPCGCKSNSIGEPSMSTCKPHTSLPDVFINEPAHYKINKMASTQSDQSIRCPHEESLDP